MNGSDERIVIVQRDSGDGGVSGGGGHETDLESGGGGDRRGEGLRHGGIHIVKQTSVEVTEVRRSDEDRTGGGGQRTEDIGDYYLVRQGRRDAADRLGRKGSDKRQRRSNGFGIGRGF